MSERSIAHLEEFLDILVALPHDAQRILTRMREEEAFVQQRQTTLQDAMQRVASKKRPNKTDYDELLQKLMSVISVSDEKVALARSLHQLVQNHVKHLEDQVCSFEEEVKLARKYGEFEEEEDEEEEDADEENTDGDKDDHVNGDKDDNDNQGSPEQTMTKKANTKTTQNRSFKRKNASESLEGQYQNQHQQQQRHQHHHSHSPKQAYDPAEFDSIPSNTNATISSASMAKKSRRSDPTTLSLIKDNNNKPPTVDKSKDSDATSFLSFSATEPTYCYCNQVSFGEMVGCDNTDCDIEWFHYGCVGLSAPPPGKWYCPDCTARDIKAGGNGTGAGIGRRGRSSISSS